MLRHLALLLTATLAIAAAACGGSDREGSATPETTAAELPTVRFHDLRRTAASFLAAMGVHQRTAMEILGHSSTAMTQEVYTDVMPGLLQEAAARMDSLLAPGDRA